MRWNLEQITRKSSGDRLRRRHVVDAEELHVGRGSGCSLHLPDPGVLLHHATLRPAAHGLHIRPEAGADLLVNGALVAAGQRLQPGDRVQVGPFTLDVEVPEAGADVQLAYELTRPRADVGAQQRRALHGTRERVGLSMRQWAWGLGLIGLVALLLLPLLGHYAGPVSRLAERGLGAAELPVAPAQLDALHGWLTRQTTVWNSGPISSAHRPFADACRTCHVDAFVQVTDATCAACHADVRHHADPAVYDRPPAEAACQSCHKEHNGLQEITRRDQAFCAACHRDLAAIAAASDLGPAADFGRAHPAFRPTVMVDPETRTTRRVPLAEAPVERSGLKFAHTDHLDPEGVRHPEKGRVQVTCADCHVTEPGGTGMQPIDFDTHCAACHRMTFEPAAPGTRLPHGDPAAALQTVRATYAQIALQGGYDGEATAPSVVRRRPGTPLADAQRPEALAWAQTRAAEVITGELGKGLCGDCHTVVDPQAPDTWDVVPVGLVDTWLPKGRFHHASHRDQACSDCHAAETSTRATDVLLPEIDSCRTCHGGAEAAAKVPSTCIDCHAFHQTELPRMHPVPAAASAP